MSAVFVYGNGGCSPYREYVQGTLSSALVPGQQYCIEFYVSLADNSVYACNNIGVYFTTAPFYSASMCVYNVTPQVNYTGIITNKSDWTLISLSFTPTQAFTNFTIGNFFNDASTATTNVGGTLSQTRYFLDDVDIHLCNSMTVTVNSPTICAGQTTTLNATSNLAGTNFTWNTGASGSTLTVSPNTTTSYTVTGTASGGATASAVATVTVNPNPAVSASAAPNAVCNGQCTNLAASGASTYSWMPGGQSGATINVCPTTNTTYTVTGTSTAGCSATSQIAVTVNPVPVVSALATPNAVCAGQCTDLSASGASTYTWMPGNLNGNTVNVCPASGTTYTVTGTTTAGCSATASVGVTVNSSPVITATASPQAVCAGQCSNLSASGASTYTWMPGSLTGTTVNVCPTSTTVYSVTGTSGPGCSGTSTVTVTVNPLPTLTAATSPTGICPGQSATLSASGASTYSWMPGNLSGTPVTVSPASTTVYTLTGITAAGCSSSTSVTVNVYPVPVITAAASPATLCPGGCTDLSASGASSYTWMPGSLIANTVNVCPNATTTYTVTGSSAQGCTATTNVVVNIAATPVVTAVASPASICQGQCTTINGSGADSYTWQPGGITGSSVNVCPSATTEYSVLGTSQEGCIAAATLTVNVTPLPLVYASASNDTLCFGESAHVFAGGAQNYLWQPEGLSGAYATVYPDATTTYTVTGSVNGCSATATVTINVYPYPVITFDADRREGCEDLLVQFADQSNFADASWYWEFGDHTFSYEQNPQHYFYDQGTYDVSLTMTTIYGCTTTYLWPDMITVYKSPEAEFTSVPDCPTELSPTVWFYDCSLGASAWKWDFGDYNAMINNSSEQNPIHQYSDTGNFEVTLIALTGMGCADTARHTIFVAPEVAIFIPNAFTPNLDGENSNFICKGNGIRWETFEMRIYDRWGKQILYTQDALEGWNGEFNGKSMPQDVYVWMINFVDIRQQKHKLKGTVTLVR